MLNVHIPDASKLRFGWWAKSLITIVVIACVFFGGVHVLKTSTRALGAFTDALHSVNESFKAIEKMVDELKEEVVDIGQRLSRLEGQASSIEGLLRVQNGRIGKNEDGQTKHLSDHAAGEFK